MSDEIDRITQAIAALEAQRGTLGDHVADAAIAPLRAALEAALEGGPAVPTEAAASHSRPTQSRPPDAQEIQDARRDQRKQVTILFADVSGFTALSEALDAEEVRDLINALWERLDAVIAARGGYIDKHIGDAVMAVFGVPVSREDDAVRAIQAGLELQKELARFAEANVPRRADGQPGLAMRVGLHTGAAVVGEVGSTAEYTAIGDTVNTASRLEGLAPVGGVLVSEATLDQVHGLFETRRMDPARVKGKSEPVHTALVLGEVERTFRDPRRARSNTPLVGREQELDRLLVAVSGARTAADSLGGAVRAVLVTGEAGIGKSRLLRALDEEMLAQSEPPLVLRGRAEQSDRDRPYALIGAALRDLRDSSPSGQGARFDPEEEAAVSFVLGLPNMERVSAGTSHAREEQERTWSLLVRALERTARASVLEPAGERHARTGHDASQPRVASAAPTLVLMVEDLHWADPTSLAFLEFLLGRWANGALVLVATSRTPLQWRTDEPPWEELALGPLNESQVRALAAAVLGPAATSQMLDELGERGSGNPYFVEELARLVHDASLGEPGRPAAMSRLPGTLTALLQARLDTLDPRMRRAAESAAVAGDAFWDHAAQAAEAARSDGLLDLTARLDSLEDEAILERRPENDLLLQTAAVEIGEVRAWVFRHVLFHDVVYEGVLLRERKPMHRAVADWLMANAVAQHELSAEVADHLERSDTPRSAAVWRLRAALRGLAAYANEEALSQADRGIGVSDEEATTFDLRECRRQALSRLGRRDEEAAEVRAMTEAAATLGTSVQARGALAEADLAWSTADYSAAQAAARRALALAQRDGDRALEAASLKELGRAAREMGDLDQAAQTFERAESAFADAGDLSGRANALVQLGTVAAHRGEAARATRLLTTALEVARGAGDVWDEAWALDNLAIVQFESGKLDLANQAARSSLALAIRGGLLFREALSRANLAGMLLLTGRAEEAATEADSAHALCLRIGDEYGAVLALVTLGEARLAQAESTARAQLTNVRLAAPEPAGQADLSEAHKRARRLGAPYPCAVAARAVAASLLSTPWSLLPVQPDPARALRAARESIRQSVRADDPAGQALARALETLALSQSGATSASVSRSAKKAQQSLAAAPDDGSAIQVQATLAAALDHAVLYDAAAEALERRADAIGDDATRRSFTSGVPLHRWLLQRRGV